MRLFSNGSLNNIEYAGLKSYIWIGHTWGFMDKNLLLQLNKVEKLAGQSKLWRFCHHPLRYLTAIGHRLTCYKLNQKPLMRYAAVFFDQKMCVALPAGTDIYLTGGKSHDSEIRLARYLIRFLQPGDHFMDIGAHFGYFTLLAGKLVTDTGRVLAFEPGRDNYSILQQNTGENAHIKTYAKAVSDQSGTLTFYEFPNLHSEYNTKDIRQFESASWFDDARPVATQVEATSLDDVIEETGAIPKIIKIDVEGGEAEVVRGGRRLLSTMHPVVIMEYLNADRQNDGHIAATKFMRELGYGIHIISPDGTLKKTDDIEAYLAQNHLDSDNVVFKKTGQ